MSLTNFFRGRKPEDHVVFDDVRVTRTRTDGVKETIRWDELGEVGIVTTDEGPFAEDVYLILLSMDNRYGCSVPQGIKGADALLSRLQALPGFDNKAVIAAMKSRSNDKFTCWKKSSAK
jgi:hypothetical protein